MNGWARVVGLAVDETVPATPTRGRKPYWYSGVLSSGTGIAVKKVRPRQRQFAQVGKPEKAAIRVT